MNDRLCDFNTPAPSARSARSLSTPEADQFFESSCVKVAVGEGQAGQGPGFSGRAEITDRNEGVFVEGFSVPFQDVDHADHGGNVDVLADDDRAGGGDVSPATAGVATVLSCEKTISVLHIILQRVSPPDFVFCVDSTNDLDGNLQVLNLATLNFDSTDQKLVVSTEVVVISLSLDSVFTFVSSSP